MASANSLEIGLLQASRGLFGGLGRVPNRALCAL